MARKFPSGIDLMSQRAVNVGDPSTASDGVNLGYLQNFIRGLSLKAPVRVATTAAITLTGPGASIDGIALSVDDRVLVKNQATPADNGIYLWKGTSTAMVRAVDADSAGELAPGSTVYVVSGTVNADRSFSIISDAAITIGTTAMTWDITGGAAATYSAGAGLLLASGVFSLDTSVAVRKYATTIGDGSATSIVVTHNLGTQDVQIQVRDATTRERVEPDDVATTVNTVTITFGTAPAVGAYRAIVQG